MVAPPANFPIPTTGIEPYHPAPRFFHLALINVSPQTHTTMKNNKIATAIKHKQACNFNFPLSVILQSLTSPLLFRFYFCVLCFS
jgi:hypothetical protein